MPCDVLVTEAATAHPSINGPIQFRSRYAGGSAAPPRRPAAVLYAYALGEAAAHSGWATPSPTRPCGSRRHRRTPASSIGTAGRHRDSHCPVSEMPGVIAAGAAHSAPSAGRSGMALSRRQHWLRLGLDAGARDATPKGLRRGLCAFRPRRLAGTASPSKTAGQSACWPPMATPMRSWPTCKVRASRRRRWPHPTEKRRRGERLRRPAHSFGTVSLRRGAAQITDSLFQRGPAGDAAWALHLLTGRRPQAHCRGPGCDAGWGGLQGSRKRCSKPPMPVGSAKTLALVLPAPPLGTTVPAAACSLAGRAASPAWKQRRNTEERPPHPVARLPGGPAPLAQQAHHRGAARRRRGRTNAPGPGPSLWSGPRSPSTPLDDPQPPTAGSHEAGQSTQRHAPSERPFSASPNRSATGRSPPCPQRRCWRNGWKWDGVRCQLVRREGKTALVQGRAARGSLSRARGRSQSSRARFLTESLAPMRGGPGPS